MQAGGLLLEGTSDINISSNTFSSVRPKAIEVLGDSAPEGIVLSGNLVVDAPSDQQVLIETPGNQVSGNLQR